MYWGVPGCSIAGVTATLCLISYRRDAGQLPILLVEKWGLHKKAQLQTEKEQAQTGTKGLQVRDIASR
jgi:hypothetical protein